MARIKTMGASPLTGQIFYGTLNTDTSMWVGKKTDVTDIAVPAVAEHLMRTKKDRAFGLHNGKYLILRHEVVDELPEEFSDSGDK